MKQSIKQLIKFTQLIMLATFAMGSSHLVWANSHDDHANHTEQQSQIEQLIQTTGVVKQIDLTNKKVTITHEAIPEINWPAMTMRFTAEDLTLIDHLNPNDKVSFEFVQQGSLSILRSMKVVE